MGSKFPVKLLVPGVNNISVLESSSPAVESPETNSGALPLLLSAAEVHHLKREEAERGYPVKIKGVITSVCPNIRPSRFRTPRAGCTWLISPKAVLIHPKSGR